MNILRLQVCMAYFAVCFCLQPQSPVLPLARTLINSVIVGPAACPGVHSPTAMPKPPSPERRGEGRRTGGTGRPK